jgi:RNA polymerase sigma-70 factor (ECF subfamily)
MSPDPDRDVLRAIAQGNREAITELYDRHAPHLLNYLAHLTDDANVAQDLVQDLFVVVWRDAERFRGQSSVRTWLFGIAHHLGVTALRRKRTLPLDESCGNGLADSSPDLEDLAVLAVDQERLEQALRTLSVMQRVVVELVFYHSRARAEIAQILECPLGTVKSRLHYALRALTHAMREKEDNLEGEERG